MARKADLGEPRGDLSQRTAIHNSVSQQLHQHSLNDDESTIATSSQLQQYINQNKVLARRNGILSSRITELEEKITSLNDELTRLRKNDALKLALELVEKNLVNSFNVSMKQLQRIRVDNRMHLSAGEQTVASTNYKSDVIKKNEEVKSLMSKESTVPKSKTKPVITQHTPTIKNGPDIQNKPEIPQFFKKDDQFDSTSKLLTILDELDSEDMFDIRQVGVFAKEPTVVFDEDSDKYHKSDTEVVHNAVSDKSNQESKNNDDKDDFLAEFGRHESSFVEESKNKRESRYKENVELKQTTRKRLSIMPDMLDYEALLESLKFKGDSNEVHKEDDEEVQGRGEDSAMNARKKKDELKQRTRSSRKCKTNLDNEIQGEMVGDNTVLVTNSATEIEKESGLQIPEDITEPDGEVNSRATSMKRVTPTPPSRSKQRRLKRIQIKEDSPAVDQKGSESTATTELKFFPKEGIQHAIEPEVIELDQSPDKYIEKDVTSEGRGGKRKPLSNLTTNVKKPTKKRKQTRRNEDWGLDIFDLRNA